MRPRLTTLALVGLGTLVGHAMAYAVPGAGAATDATHGYLRIATLLAIPVALVATVVLLRRDGEGIPRLVELAGCQIVVYVLQETAERSAMGMSPGSLFADPVLWWGLLAQVTVAALARMSIRISVRLARFLRRLLRPEGRLGVVGALTRVERTGRPRRCMPDPFRTRAPPVPVV